MSGFLHDPGLVTEEELLWCRRTFDSIVDGGVWGIPRSGLIFTRRGNKLVLTAAMPYMPELMEGVVTRDELIAQQGAEFIQVRERFGAAGIKVIEAIEEDTDARP